MKNHILIAAALAASLSVYAQESEKKHASQQAEINGEVIKCFTTETQERRRLENENISSDQEFELWLSDKIKVRTDQGKSEMPVVTLPVIFHVVHSGEPKGVDCNVSAASIYAQIEQLNNDFRRMAGTSGYNNDPVGADLRIEFCPAQVDPLGNPLPEPGIERINGSNRSWGEDAYSTSYFDYFVKPATIWNPDDYLNIWVSPTSSYFYTVLGYAQFPTMSGLDGLDGQPDGEESDGVVVSPYTLGSSDFPNPNAIGNTGMGRTLTHEMGHFFGLRHIWGDGGCDVDDYCVDTPSSGAANEGCPTGTMSCGSIDMIENYMDYTDDPCKNLFTQDQNARVQAVLANSPRRSTLATSKKCEVPTACIAPTTGPVNLNATVNGTGALLSWKRQTNTKGCQVEIGYAQGSQTNTALIPNFQANQFHIGSSSLQAGKNYRWRVRCGCTQFPLVVGPWSAWHQFSTPSGMFGVDAQDDTAIQTPLEVEIFPNPATDFIHVIVNDGNEVSNTTIDVFDLMGRRVLSQKFSSDDTQGQIALPEGLKGVYMVRVASHDQIISRKIIVD